MIRSALPAAQESARLDARDRVKLGAISAPVDQLTISQDLMLSKVNYCSLSQEGGEL